VETPDYYIEVWRAAGRLGGWAAGRLGERVVSNLLKKMLLEQHLNAARAAYCCSSSNLLVEQHLNAARAAKFLLEQQNAARAAFIFRISH
ncbi:hypothetical protein DPMN_172049, partial [Dreissena polymorpha]